MEDLNRYSSCFGKLLENFRVDRPRVPFTPRDAIDNDGQFSASAHYWQSTFRMRLSYHMFALLYRLSNASICTIEQKEKCIRLQERYVEETHSLANRILHTSAYRPLRRSGSAASSSSSSSSPSSPQTRAEASNDDNLASSTTSSLEEEQNTDQTMDQTSLFSRKVTCYIDFGQEPEQNSTLFCSNADSGILVIPLIFEIDKRR